MYSCNVKLKYLTQQQKKKEKTLPYLKQCSMWHNTGTTILKLTICNILITKDCLQQFMNIDTILNLPFFYRTKHTMPEKKTRNVNTHTIKYSWANRGSFVLYPDDVIFVESSINLIASIFLSGSKRYIISAPAARCIKEAGKEISSTKSKIPDQDNTH